MKMHSIILTSIISAGLLSSPAQAELINFFAIADPQFGYHDGENDGRAAATMRDVALLTKKCTDCVQVVPIAGDLSSDGDGRTPYGNAHKNMESQGVKVLDGLGNHDSHDFADDETTFDSYTNLVQMQDLSGKGWQLFHHEFKKMSDSGTDACKLFNNSPRHYCEYADAAYYTMALAKLGTTQVAAYLVQLHNGLTTNAAIDYLRSVKAEIARVGDANAPVIIVAHQLGIGGNNSSSYVDPITNLEVTVTFKDIVKDMNVAAFIMGHTHCSSGDHCDYSDNEPSDTVSAAFVNQYGGYIPKFNVNAAFHNIFWGFSLDTVSNKISFARFDRAHIGDFPTDYRGTFAAIIRDIDDDGRNMPYASTGGENTFTCDYTLAINCINQIPRRVWGPTNFYDSGKEPSIALNDNNTVVEVHRSGSNSSLYYSIGTLSGEEITFGNSVNYDTGIRPVVSINNDDSIVEIHKSASNDGLWIHTGSVVTISNSIFGFSYSTRLIDWGPSRSLNNSGVYPSIALNDNNLVMEVHQSQHSDDIWYRVGNADFNSENIDWWSTAKCLTCNGSVSGENPQVSLNNNNEFIVVWHSGIQLYSQTGTLFANKTMQWGEVVNYDSGYRPSVALMDDGSSVEVHQSKYDGSNDVVHQSPYDGDYLWSSDGVANGDKQDWKSPLLYTKGHEPRVSVNNNNISVEVHKNEKDGVNSIYYTVGRSVDHMKIIGLGSNCLTTNGTNVFMASCTANNNQYWKLTTSGEIRNISTNKCLNVIGSTGSSGSEVNIDQCFANNIAQKWDISSSGQIRNRQNDICLNVNDGYSAPNMDTCDDEVDSTQEWRLFFYK